MTVEEKVQDVLEAASALTAIVPASRIRPPGSYQNVERPWIVHQPVGGIRPIYTYDGLVKLRFWANYQITIFADDYPSGRAVTELVIPVLTGNHDGMQVFWAAGGFLHFRHAELAVEQFVLTFSIYEALAS